ncbi:helix-turn-helix domain-containing protein [Vogesella indigofera]
MPRTAVIERIELDVLDALCRYFNCQLGDLLEYAPKPVPSTEKSAPAE